MWYSNSKNWYCKMKKFWYNKINKWITKRTTIRFAVESLFPLKLEPDSSCAKGRRKEWVVIMKKDMRYYVEISGQRMEENLTRRRELLGELADLYRKSNQTCYRGMAWGPASQRRERLYHKLQEQHKCQSAGF